MGNFHGTCKRSTSDLVLSLSTRSFDCIYYCCTMVRCSIFFWDVMALDSLATGVSPLLFRVQQPPVPQSRATTSNHGLRVPDLPKRRRDCGQWPGVSERSFKRHKVSSSIDRPSSAGNFGQRTGGCNDGSRPGPDPGTRIVLPLDYIRSFFFGYRHTLTFLVQTAAMKSTHFCLLLGGDSHCSPVRV